MNKFPRILYGSSVSDSKNKTENNINNNNNNNNKESLIQELEVKTEIEVLNQQPKSPSPPKMSFLDRIFKRNNANPPVQPSSPSPSPSPPSSQTSLPLKQNSTENSEDEIEIILDEETQKNELIDNSIGATKNEKIDIENFVHLTHNENQTQVEKNLINIDNNTEIINENNNENNENNNNTNNNSFLSNSPALVIQNLYAKMMSKEMSDAVKVELQNKTEQLNEISKNVLISANKLGNIFSSYVTTNIPIFSSKSFHPLNTNDIWELTFSKEYYKEFLDILNENAELFKSLEWFVYCYFFLILL